MATAMALQLIVAVLGILTAPTTLVFMAWMHGLKEEIPIGPVAWQVFTVQLVPLSLGLLLKARFPDRMVRLSKPLTRLANLSMLVLILLSLVIIGPVLLQVRLASWIAMAAVAACSLLFGHLLGGPSRETRVATAVISANRNLGLAIFLASFVHAEKAANLIVIFSIVNFFVGSLYKSLALRGPNRAETEPGAP